MEFDVPQLRQMVLDNTSRIEKNESVISRVGVEAAGQTQKISSLEEWLENSRRERELDIRRSRERMDRLEKLAEESRIEHERFRREDREQWKETRKEVKEMFAETRRDVEEMYAKTHKEVNEMFAETRKDVEEMSGKTREDMNKMIADTNAFLRRFSIELLGVTGHIVEGLVSSSTENIFKKAGFILHNSGKNLKRGIASENKQMEVDVMLGNEKVVVPVEVKSNFTKNKVKRFIHKMEQFRSFFPECADKEVVAAVAAINYDTDADVLAHEEGLLVIRVSSDDIFTIDPVDEKQLRKF